MNKSDTNHTMIILRQALKHTYNVTPDEKLLEFIVCKTVDAYKATDEYERMLQRLDAQQNMLNMMLRHVPAHERASAEQALNDMLRDQSSERTIQ